VPSGQSVTIFNWRNPCAIAGAGKLMLAPAADDAAPARISRRLMLPTVSADAGRGASLIGLLSFSLFDHAMRSTATMLST
jgi:hypothetical protein